MFYTWFKDIGGLHGLGMTFCIALRLPLLYMRNMSKFKGIPLFLFTLPCFAPCPTYRFVVGISPMIYCVLE